MKKKIYKKWWFWIIAIIVVIIVNDTFINPGEDAKEEQQIKIEEKAKAEKKAKEIATKKAEEEKKKTKEKEKNKKSILITTAQKTVKDNLKAPNTAKFPWSFDEYNIKESNNENKDMIIYYVSGYVDAENSFGAKLRSNFIVKMECTKDLSKYKVLDVKITE